MTSLVVCDFESDRNGIVHTIAARSITLGTGFEKRMNGMKTRSGKRGLCPVNVYTVNASFVIKLTDTVVGDVNEKHASDVNTCLKTDFMMLFMTFVEAVDYLIHFTDFYGGILVSHCLHNDLGFLGVTQDHVGGKRIVKKTIHTSPKTGMYVKTWENFTLVCSQSLLCTKCPKFMKEYRQSNPYKTASGKYSSTELQSFSRFVKGDQMYVQGHSAAQDVIDLCEVLKEAYEYDGDKMFDGYDCLNWDIYKTLPKAVPEVTEEKPDDPPTEKQKYFFKKLYDEKYTKLSPKLILEMKTNTITKKLISGYIDTLKQL